MIFLEKDASKRNDCKIFKPSFNRKKRTKITMNVYDKTSSAYTDMMCILLYISDIKKNDAENKYIGRETPSISSIDPLQKIQIELSRKVNLELIKKDAREYPFEVYLVTKENNSKQNHQQDGAIHDEKRVLIPMSDITQCTAISKWEKGIGLRNTLFDLIYMDIFELFYSHSRLSSNSFSSFVL